MIPSLFVSPSPPCACPCCFPSMSTNHALIPFVRNGLGRTIDYMYNHNHNEAPLFTFFPSNKILPPQTMNHKIHALYLLPQLCIGGLPRNSTFVKVQAYLSDDLIMSGSMIKPTYPMTPLCYVGIKDQATHGSS